MLMNMGYGDGKQNNIKIPFLFDLAWCFASFSLVKISHVISKKSLFKCNKTTREVKY